MEENHSHKHNALKELYGVIFFFFILLFIYSKFGPSLPFSVLSQQKGEPLVVDGSGKVSITPDIAKVSLGIEQNGSSLKTVQESVNKKSKELVDALKELDIDEKDIKTTSYNVYPQYDYSAATQRITGYSVSTSYQATIDNFDKVNEVLVAATAVGANSVGGITFEVNEKTRKDKLQEARELAVKEASQKAEGLAKASNINLGKIINISENMGSSISMRQYAELPISGGGDLKSEVTNPDIQPGETELSVTVFLSYEIR